MPLTNTTFQRNFNGVKNPNIQSPYPYIPSGDDKIENDLAQICIIDGVSDSYTYVEEGSSANLTNIRTSREPRSLGPTYITRVYVQTIGLSYHPTEVLELLRQHEFLFDHKSPTIIPKTTPSAQSRP